MTLNRKRIATLIAGAGLLASMLFAAAASAMPGGGERPGGDRLERRFEKMQAELGLSADQATQIKAIMESSKDEMKALHEQMKATLTPEQQAQMKAWREQRKQGGERPSREAMKERFEQLGLTDQQREQMRSVREQIKAKRESVRSQIHAVLTPEQQAKMEVRKAEFQNKRGRHGRRGHRGGGGDD
jgi:Spy/CpxP family protein refolding chaperone